VGVSNYTTLVIIALALPSDLSLKSLLEFFGTLENYQKIIPDHYHKIPAILLAIATVAWYFAYKSAVFYEIDLVDEMFSEKHKPTHFGGLTGHKYIRLLGYVLVITYAILILTVTKIQIYLSVALALHVADLLGNILVLQNLAQTMDKFRIVDATPAARFVRERREIIRAYYFDNPTLLRVGVLLIITGASLVLSVNVDQHSPAKLGYIPYGLMIANIIVGEVVIKRWRLRRDRLLDEVAEREQEEHLRSFPESGLQTS
jgi:hypothetical protein